MLDQVERQTEMAEKNNHLLVAVLAALREGVVIVNPQLQIVLYNSAAAQIIKLPPPEDDSQFGQSTPVRLVDATRDPAIYGAFHQALADRIAVQTRVDLIDGDSRSFQLNVALLGPDLAVGVFFDITEHERFDRVRREFFANLSHELRTPLTAILAYAETLLDGGIDDPDNRNRFVEKLHKHATRMNDLISDIADLSAIESGQIKLALSPVRLSVVVSEAVLLSQARNAEKDVSFVVKVPENLFVHADRTRLEQILWNLIDNSVKFSRGGGTVTVSAAEDGERVLLSVKDSGIGIADGDLPRVFERLYRADKSRSRKTEGTGLGLAIVKHLVHAHGGEVMATSKIGEGSEFTFTLPGSTQLSEDTLDDVPGGMTASNIGAATSQ